MTATNGTYMFCDSDLSFSITMTCTGPSCSSILSHSNLTCTQSGSESWQCTNGIKCDSATSFTSKFSIAQTNQTVLQTQEVSMNGTSFTFLQSGEGNATVFNTSSKSGAISSRKSLSVVLLLGMLVLGLLIGQTQATFTGKGLVDDVNNILNCFNEEKSIFALAVPAIAQEYNQLAVQICNTFLTKGVESLTGLGTAFLDCNEALVGAEILAIGSPLGLTLRTYAGLGGILTTALTAADTEVVLAADAGAIPEIFIANAAFCGLLVAVIRYQILEKLTENVCSELGNAVASHWPSSASTSASSTSTSTSTSFGTITTSQAATTATGSPIGSLLPVPSISSSSTAAQCMLCVIESWFLSFPDYWCDQPGVGNQPLSNYYLPAKDLIHIFCDPSVASEPDFASLCLSACTYPCNQYNTTAWATQYRSLIQDNLLCPDVCGSNLGSGSCPSQFVPYPITCSGVCPGAETCGWCEIVNGGAYPGGKKS